MTETIVLTEAVESPYCVSSSDGLAVHDCVAEQLRKGTDVVVSFAGVEEITSAFLNAAIGQLYGEFPEEAIRDHLHVIGADRDHLVLLKRVVDRAKDFFRDPNQFAAAVSGVLGE
jgi:hypothetical protein